eukprot:Selendium_serpulae@DN8416_c0_g1_i1.p2
MLSTRTRRPIARRRRTRRLWRRVASMAFNPSNERELLIASTDKVEVVRVMESTERITSAAALRQSGGDGPAGALRLPKLKVVTTIRRFKGEVKSATIRADGKMIATGEDSGLVQLFNSTDGNQLRRLGGHQGPVHACQFTAEGTSLVTASDDQSLRHWDISTGSPAVVLRRLHRDAVRSVAAGPPLLSAARLAAVKRRYDSRAERRREREVPVAGSGATGQQEGQGKKKKKKKKKKY